MYHMKYSSYNPLMDLSCALVYDDRGALHDAISQQWGLL